MSQDLCADVPSSIYLNTRTSHLKRTPVLMLDQILKQPFWALVLFLGLRVGYTGTVGYNLFCVWCNPDKLCGGHTKE